MIKNFQEIISQLKSQVPINELISEFVPVKKSGRNYVCICPFHDDHHPSLQINVQKGIFKCFACGTGGDLITFYALINKKKMVRGNSRTCKQIWTKSRVFFQP